MRISQVGPNVIQDFSGMTEESMAEYREGMDEYARSLPRKVAEDANTVRELLGSLPTLPALATLGFLTYALDPDTYVEWEREYVSNQVEWPTRVALSLPTPIPLDPASPVLDPAQFQTLLDTIQRLYFNLKHLIGSESVRRKKTKPGPLDVIIMLKRLHELSMRTLIYDHQQRAWLRRLFAPLKGDLDRLIGFDVEHAIGFVAQIGTHVNERVRERLAKGTGSVESVRPLLQEKGITRRDEQDKEIARLLSMWQTSFMDDAFTVSSGDLHPSDRATNFLDRFSLSFGLPEAPRPGPVTEVLERPLVSLGGGAYLAHMPLWLEAVKPNLESALKGDQNAWIKYEDLRAHELENVTAALWKAAIPAAAIDCNLTFTAKDGKPGELDVMCRVDRTLILCECKAGEIAPRHHQSRMLRSLKKGLRRAHEQGLKARDHLVSGGGEFFTLDGHSLRLSADDYDQIVLSVVTLDDVSAFTTNMAYAVGAQIFGHGELPWAVSVTDFEIIADMVDLSVLLPNYIMRRARIAPWEKFTAIEELDWFMHYLSQGLWFADDLSEAPPTNLMSFTKPLDDYYMFVYGPRLKPAAKPSIGIQPKYKELLRLLEEAHPTGWLEAAHILMDIDHETRKTVLRFKRDLLRKPGPAGRTLFVGDRMIAIYAEPAGLGLLRPAMVKYATAHMVTNGKERCAVIGVNPKYPDSAPLFAYVDAHRDPLPSKIAAAAFLSQFNSTYLNRSGERTRSAER